VAARGDGAGLRADARRNREQIVRAAGALFAERGPDAAMEEVARRAGVGVGTLYRRFPDREALVRAVALEGFEHVMATARVAAGEPDGWSALTRLVRESAADLRLAILLSMWFTDTWAALEADAGLRRRRVELLDLLDGLVGRAQREGAVRPDVGAGDLALLLALVLRPLPGRLQAPAERATERVVALVLDGLRARPPQPLPGEPVPLPDLAPPRPPAR
jgi:AcrR family transcriptional regulator